LGASTYYYGNIIHITVKPDGKVWLHQDGTNLNVALKLVDKGIAKNEIVLGFKAPVERALMEGWALA
jgi:hypothetical protein